MKAGMEDDAVAVRAAWLYYMEGLTQDRVAEQLGLTRLRVNRLLSDARASGLVQITLNTRLASCLAVEAELKASCGLQDAVIVPTPQDPALVPVLLGRAAGEFLSRHLESNRVRSIGVGWGATLRETIRFVKPGAGPDINVNSMMGGLTRGLEINTFETAAALAARLGGRCSYLAAPLYAGSRKLARPARAKGSTPWMRRWVESSVTLTSGAASVALTSPAASAARAAKACATRSAPAKRLSTNEASERRWK